LALRDAIQIPLKQRLRANLDFLHNSSADSPCRVLPVEGGWYATLQMPRTRSEEAWVLELLERDDVLTQPGFFYDFPSEAYLVLSLLTPPATFRDGVERILRRSESP
jgi:aspartate/methionine/tyrosine aminotransferase